MPQFFLPLDSVAAEGQAKTFHLKGPEAFHITKVLRYREGQSVILFDGRGGRFEGIIRKLHSDGSVSGDVTATLESGAAAPAVDLRLYQGLLKASHWELVLEKGTELGVAAFVPVLTPRTVVLLREVERARAKQERWNRVVMAAAKQCQRGSLPGIHTPLEFRDAIKACSGEGLTVLAWEGLCGSAASSSLAKGLREGLSRRGDHPLRVNLFVGPEGGFTDDEVELAESLGALVFGLGPRILRAETAALAAAALIQYEAGCL